MKALFSILILLGFYSTLFSQQSLSFERMSTEDGLSANKANAILQDKDGYLWVGTWNGLNRYDGYSFQTYAPILRDTSSLSNREIVALLEGKDGNIWIGTTSGLNCFNIDSEEITSFPFSHRIISLCQDDNNNIWVGTWNDGLYILNPKNGSSKHFFTTDIISDISKGKDGNYWIATYNGLIEFNTKTGINYRYLPDGTTNSLSNQTVTQVKCAKDGSVWIGSWGGGLSKLTKDNENNKAIFQHYKSDPTNPTSLVSNVIYRIYIDEFENIWCGTWSSGLCVLPQKEQSKALDQAVFISYKNDNQDPNSVSGNNISALFVDHSGMLWVGAQTLDKSYILNSSTTTYKHKYTYEGQSLANTSRSLLFDDNQLYVGSLHDLYIYDYKDSSFEINTIVTKPSYTHANTYFESTSILSLAKNKHGLWVGTDDAGLLLYDSDDLSAKKPRLKRYFNSITTSCPTAGNKISCILASKKDPNTIWTGSLQNGVTRIQYDGTSSSSKIIRAGNSAQNISSNDIRVIQEDRDGIVWIGTQNGLNRYNPKTERVQKFFYSQKNTNSINDNVINCIFEDDNGTLWIGTNTGLNKKITMTNSDNKEYIAFKSYPNLKQIGSGIIGHILQDIYGMLWVKPYHGLFRFDPYNERIVRDYSNKEFSTVNIEGNAKAQSPEGIICYGTNEGFITLHPDDLTNKSRVPKLTLTDIKVSNRSIKSESDVAIPHLHDYRLSPSKKTITFEFSAMDFKSPNNNQYTYFLEGADDTWHNIGKQNSITFNSLKHGKYTLHVKAANSDGKWTDKALMINLRVLPAWHQTLVAQIAYILLFIIILYFFNKFSVIKAKEKSRLMLELVKSEKEQKINELKTLFFTDITHEFRTPLTLIQGPAEEIMNQENISPYIAKQADLILRNSNRLMRMINQLMDFRKVDRQKMDILWQKCTITDILKDVYDGYKGVALSRRINFTLNLEKDNVTAYLDTDKVEKILFNLASNAFKYSNDGGDIEINFILQEKEDTIESLIIEIKDDGIGIAPENQERVFERFVQTHQKKTHSTGGIGLYLSKTFVEQHNGSIELTSELGKGSSFKVTLPYRDVPLEEDGSSVVNKKPIIIDNESNKKHENLSFNTLENTEETAKPKLLLVEDDYDLNNFISSSLSAEYQVITCYNGLEGYKLAQNQLPSIIISDIMMPELDGFGMCKRLREDINTSHIPIIFLTAKTMQSDQLKGLQLGAIDYINKPFNFSALKLKINNIIEARKNFQQGFKASNILDPTVPELSSLDEKLLKDAVEAVNANIDNPEFDVERFGKVIGLSPNQAYRKIKSLTGQTAKEFIRNQRLKAAAALFLQKKRSISEVIYMVGFSSPSYFTRCFKEYYNCTPKEYIANDGEVSSKDEEES